jgi:hypothetical protein
MINIVVNAPQRRGEDGLQLAQEFAGHIVHQFKTKFPGIKAVAQMAPNANDLLSVKIVGAEPADRKMLKRLLMHQGMMRLYLDRLNNSVVDVDTNCKISKRILREIAENRDGIKFATTFFIQTARCTWLDAMATLARMYECGQRRNATVNIRWMLEYIRGNYDDLYQYPLYDYHFDPPKLGVEPALSRDEIDGHLRLLEKWEEKGGVISKLAEYRNLLLFHNNRQFFADPTKFPQDKWLGSDEVTQLLAKATEILKQCYTAFTGRSTDLDVSTAEDVDQVFRRLREHREWKSGGNTLPAT